MATGLGLRVSLADPVVPDGVTQDFLFQTKLSATGGELAETAKAAGLDDVTIAASILDATPAFDKLPAYEPRTGSPAEGGS